MASVFNDLRGAFERKNDAVTKIIIINGMVFLFLFIIHFFFSFSAYTQEISDTIARQFVLNAPLNEFIRQPWTLLTYSFSHDSFLHLLFNMLAFYWFGSLLQDFIGSRKLVNIYLLGSILSGIVYISLYNLLNLAPTTLAISNVSPVISGASAAVFAVMFATITLVPDYEFYFFRLFLIKIKYVAWLFLLISFANPSSGISHAGGAFVGYLYIKLLRMGLDMGTPLDAIGRWWKMLWARKPPRRPSDRQRYSKSPVYMSSSSSSSVTNEDYYPGQDEVDAILDKIGKSGYESLSKEEKETLYRASQRKD